MNAMHFSKIIHPLGLCGLVLLATAGCGKEDCCERKAQKISCINNLKQIGLSYQIWAGDHGDKLPFQAGTNSGGTLQLCDRDTNGFDRNSLAHFLVASNELSTPLLLCCPHDRSKTPVANWSKLTATNITYWLRTDYKVSHSNPREILAVCPVDGNTLYYDGSVFGEEGRPEPTHTALVIELRKHQLEQEATNQWSAFMVMSNDSNTPRIEYNKPHQ
jgi:hypothetical protein